MSTKRNIPFSPPDITDLEIAEVVDTLKSGWLTTGPKTKKFERLLSTYTHTNKTVALNSATAALELTLHLLGVTAGDEVIVPAYTYTASCSVILHVGATPVMVDSQKDSPEMDYSQLEQKITEKTKAIIPVDLAGIMFDYDKLFAIVDSKKHLFQANDNVIQQKLQRIAIIADGAHSLGAAYQGQPSGSVADFTCFSFHAVKNLTTAEGGSVTWRSLSDELDEWIYRRYQLFSLHGQTKDALAKTGLGAWEYDIEIPAYKCNLTDIMASIGMIQLQRYPELLEKRRAIVACYQDILQNTVKTLVHPESSNHLYLTFNDDITLQQRNEIILKMAEEGVATNVHYKPLPLLTAYKRLGYNIEDYPNAYRLYEKEITLPLYSTLSLTDAEYVATTYQKVVQSYRV